MGTERTCVVLPPRRRPRLLASQGQAASQPGSQPAPHLTHPPAPLPAQRPPILLLNIELELKSEKENAEVRLEDPAQYQAIVDAGEGLVGVCGCGGAGGGGWGDARLEACAPVVRRAAMRVLQSPPVVPG